MLGHPRAPFGCALQADEPDRQGGEQVGHGSVLNGSMTRRWPVSLATPRAGFRVGDTGRIMMSALRRRHRDP